MSGKVKENMLEYKKDWERARQKNTNGTTGWEHPNADGSAYRVGQNKVWRFLYTREAWPKHTKTLKANIKVTYRMTTFSVPERKQPRLNRRDMRFQKFSRST